ncbi:NADase-type glycan-binding domain-containing protein [Intestinibacter bartlettii]|uniref:NADase-type glycan-binding domain-containing protein n=1 Tax=Intestinibacter bartlettii TaxID=261299 RepID=UPI001D02F994|nr:discoidin domain-containing protein [Intestinibacter bartlettii]MDU1252717.1 discoidin domain-containing protein [Peptostreptococcaceae bacterium]MDU5919738.1 discoidin domain-containing protein [Clostridiales bacterium]MCB5745259.1 discoidin domain-containing protein [Intestinibacter bartlettii]MDU2693748.1 discoidin domain-containing protein [Intestinibacter bartlettii]MDU4257207.1 discoidin domain-containing protein [Intestinibacter bartlettii]
MFCKYCGKKIDKNSKFCEFCGRPVGKSDSKKINLEKDEDIVYIDSHDSTEFNDYDFDNVDDFSYEESFNYNQNNKKSNNKLIMSLSCIIAVFAIAFVAFKVDLFGTNDNKPVSSISSTGGTSKNETFSKEENEDSQNIGNTHEYVNNNDSRNEIKQNSNTSNKNQINRTKNLNTINILNSECSSILHDSTNKNYGSTKVLDGDFSTVWSEGVSGYGNGEWIILDFDNIYTVKKIKIVNGLVNKKNGYYNNNRPKSLTLQFSDGSSQKINLEDNNTGYQVVNINAVETSYVKFVIDSVYYGTKYDDTCIADIEILGY